MLSDHISRWEAINSLEEQLPSVVAVSHLTIYAVVFFNAELYDSILIFYEFTTRGGT